MKSETMNHYVSIAANIGVLLGILLLAYELNQNQDMMRAQTRNELSQNVIELLTLAVNDGGFQNIIRRGGTGEELSVDEQFQFEKYLNGWFRYWENMHYQYRNGLYDENEFTKQREKIGDFISSNPGILNYWCRERLFYSPEFARELDGILATYEC